MKDIILEEDKFIIVSEDMSAQLWSMYNKGSLPKKYFQKLIFTVKQENSASAPKYSSNPRFYADINDNPDGSVTTGATGILKQLKKYYENNGIKTKDKNKKYDILNLSGNTEVVGVTEAMTQGDMGGRWYHIKVQLNIFLELNPDFVPNQTQLLNLINPAARRDIMTEEERIRFILETEIESDQAKATEAASTEDTSTADEDSADQKTKNKVDVTPALALEVTEVASIVITSFEQKIRSAANKNAEPIDKKYENFLEKFIRPKSSTGNSLKTQNTFYFGEVPEGAFKEADDLEDKNELIFNHVSKKLFRKDVDKESFKKIIDFNNAEGPGGTEIFNNQLIFFAKAPGGFNNEDKKIMFKMEIPAIIFRHAFPQSKPTKGEKSLEKKSSTSNASGKIPEKGDPSNDNVSFSDGNFNNTIIRISDLPLYCSVASVVMRDLSNKLKEYDIILDNPINIDFMSQKIDRVSEQILSILNQSSVSFSNSDYIKIKFDSEYNLIGVYFVKAEIKNNIAGKPSAQAGRNLAGGTGLFNDITFNSIIYNLSAIYNRFGTRVRQDGFIYDVQATIFFSEESIRFFLNSYVHPRSSVVNSPITRDLVEKFLIGDVRMLNDEIYKNSFMDPEQIPDGVRSNLNREMSQGYEKIGDLLGEAWITGKFERVDDVNDFKRQLLNYIDIDDLIAVSIQCLLKLIPLDELLDEICEPILKEFDAHKEKIIQELDKMEDGVAKDLAKELKEIYFNRVLGERGILGQIEGQIDSGLKKLPERAQDGSTIHSWRDPNAINLQTYVDLLYANYWLTNKTMTDEEQDLSSVLFGKADWNDNESIEKTFVYSGLTQRVIRFEKRIEDLNKDLNKVQKQLEAFNNVNEPQNLVDLRSYYTTQINELQQRLGQAKDGQLNGETLLRLYRIVLREIVPHLITINPYIKKIDKKTGITLSGVPYLTQKGITSFDDTQRLKSIKELNKIRIPEVKNNQQIFSFSETSPTPSKIIYDFQINNGFKLIIDEIQRLEKLDNSPFNALAELEQIGVKALDQTLESLFGDPTKRRKLCLAIIAAVPAAGYALYLLFRNADKLGDAGKFLKEEGMAISKAIQRKIAILGRTDYPILDILEEFVDALKQIGINIARDLIINGIIWAIGELKKMCSDDEKTNAPFSPLGVVDLSDFISTSKKGLNGAETGDVANSDSFKTFTTREPSLTKEKFNLILSTLSASLTINEIASLLDETATSSLYDKAIRIINTLTPKHISKSSSFYKYYINQSGIIEFFNILARDIEPAKIARAKQIYRESKQKILEICFGNDFSLLGDLNNSDVRQALADNYAEKTELLPRVFDAFNNFGETELPEPCEAGVDTLTESQKFTARQASESIYGSIENQFNRLSVIAKDTFIDRFANNKKYNDLPSSPDPKSFFDFTQENKSALVDLSTVADNEFVAEPIRDNTKLLIGSDNYSFNLYTNEDDERKLTFIFNDSLFREADPNFKNTTIPPKELAFDFNFSDNVLRFQYGDIAGPDPSETETGNTGSLQILVDDLAVYTKFDYFPVKDGKIIEPGDFLFGDEASANIRGIIFQPNYNAYVKSTLSNLIHPNKDDVYLKLINSILRDITSYSISSGLYRKENFLKLNLNKHITPVKLNFGNGKPPIDACFLGFANKEVLYRQTEYIAKILSCSGNSATRTPFNMAYIKILFDCFIRAAAMQEMMKSFFVLGAFPQNLIFDELTPDNVSFYEQIMTMNIAKSIETFSPALSGRNRDKRSMFSYANFYNNVFKEFVVDMSKVIFKNSELEDKLTYDFTINTQVQFIKNQFKKAFQNAFVDVESIIGVSEYQLLSQQIIDNTISAAPNDQLELSKEFTYNERIRAIQNDKLAVFFEKTKELTKNISDQGIGYDLQNTDTVFGGTQGLNFDKKIPLFARRSKDESLKEHNPTGFVLDTFIEIKPKYSAFSSIRREYIEARLVLLGREISMKLKSFGIGNMKSEQVESEFIIPMFSFTGLFALIPQAISFIKNRDLLSFYQETFKFFDSAVGATEGVLAKQYPDGIMHPMFARDISLFYWLFRYNYDPDFNSDPDAIEWYNKMVSSGLWAELDHSLTGKIKLGDFYQFIDLTLTGTNASQFDILNKFGSFDALVTPEYRFLILELVFPPNVSIFDGESFLSWLYQKNVKDLFHINTVFRIDGKLIDNNFSITNNFAKKLFNPDVDTGLSPAEQYLGLGELSVEGRNIEIQKALLQEKIGAEHYQSGYETRFDIFSMPMFEVKQPLPSNLRFIDFFMRTDEKSWFSDENFYNIFNINDETSTADVAEKISAASSINDFLFSGNKKDVRSYFYRLYNFSNALPGSDKVIANKQYLSTFWWNIKGRSVNLKAILKAIYLDFPDDVMYEFPHAEKISYKEIREALTPASLRSFLVQYKNIWPDDGDSEAAPYIRPTEGTAGPANYSETGFGPDRGVLHLTKTGPVISELLSDIEKTALVDREIESIIADQSANVSEYKIGFDTATGQFKEGWHPFIAIRDRDFTVELPGAGYIDHGFYRAANKADLYKDGPSNLTERFPGSDFQSRSGKNVPYGSKPMAIFSNQPGYSFCPLGPGPRTAYNRPNVTVEPTNEIVHMKYKNIPTMQGDRYELAFYEEPIEIAGLGTVQGLLEGPGWKNVSRGHYVKGGLGYAEESFFEKPSPGSVLNVYDLFSKTLKSDADKKAFNDFINSFFLKEQTTIVAIINRLLTEVTYPEISKIYNVLISECYKKLIIAIAVANGNYTESASTEEPSPDLEEILKQIGIILGEAFLKAVATTVDPTWQTPWFAPGPLTPFGIAAKLLGEDFSDDDDSGGSEDTNRYPPGESVCSDSLKDSTEFFDKFVTNWQETINPSNEE